MRDIVITDKHGNKYTSAVYYTCDEARLYNDGVHQSIPTSKKKGDPANGWMNWNPNGFQLNAIVRDRPYDLSVAS